MPLAVGRVLRGETTFLYRADFTLRATPVNTGNRWEEVLTHIVKKGEAVLPLPQGEEDEGPSNRLLLCLPTRDTYTGIDTSGGTYTAVLTHNIHDSTNWMREQRISDSLGVEIVDPCVTEIRQEIDVVRYADAVANENEVDIIVAAGQQGAGKTVDVLYLQGDGEIKIIAKPRGVGVGVGEVILFGPMTLKELHQRDQRTDDEAIYFRRTPLLTQGFQLQVMFRSSDSDINWGEGLATTALTGEIGKVKFPIQLFRQADFRAARVSYKKIEAEAKAMIKRLM